MLLESENVLPVTAVLCLGSDSLNRFGRVMRHLAVGLVDQAINLIVLSNDRRAESLALGPVQALLHDPIRGPLARRRLRRIADDLEDQPPTVIHAFSAESFRLSMALAEAFDADLIVHITSLADCGFAESLDISRVAQWLAFSEPLAKELASRIGVPRDHVDLIRPGILASSELAFGAEPQRVPTMICTAPLVRGSGVDRLVEALAILQRRGRGLLTFLLGEGRYERVVRSRVRELKLSSTVIFSHPGGEGGQALHSADLFVWPAADDAFWVDGVAAMGAGLAVVTMPSAVCDHLHDGQTAILCRSLTADALADAIEQVLVDAEVGRRIAAGGQQYVRTHHAVSTMSERIAGAYRKLALPRATFSIAGS